MTITCLFCDYFASNIAGLREHSAICPNHPLRAQLQAAEERAERAETAFTEMTAINESVLREIAIDGLGESSYPNENDTDLLSEKCYYLRAERDAAQLRATELEAHVERLVKAANGLPCWTPELSKVIDYDPLYGSSPKWYPSTVMVNAESLVEMRTALAATPAVSLSAIKAEALNDAADAIDGKYVEAAALVRAIADRIEEEARDDHN